MKKELKKANKKLSLGKMTVAKLRLTEHQMQFINGGEATKPIVQSKQDTVVDPCMNPQPRTQV
jgi:hypothetical protein